MVTTGTASTSTASTSTASVDTSTASTGTASTSTASTGTAGTAGPSTSTSTSTSAETGRDQPRILLSPPDVGPADRQALLRAFDGGWITPLGPEVDGFEAELARYVDAPACVALSSGSAALELALLAVGVRPGHEVVVQSATFAASAFAVVHVGAIPVLIDVDRHTWGLDPALLARFLDGRARTGRLPAAVMAVDLYGLCPDYEALTDICRAYDLPLIEDAAESLGSRSGGEMAGGLATLAAFSFNGNKIITTSGGGALVGPPESIDRARHLATQARQPVAHFEHHEVGFNYRLSNLLAGLGRAQLATLESKIERRIAVFERYREEIPGIEWLDAATTERPNRWLPVGLLAPGVDPAGLCQALAERNIEARRAFKPMHRQPVFATAEMIGGAVADDLFARGVCLPSGSSMTAREQDRVIVAVQEFLAATVARDRLFAAG